MTHRYAIHLSTVFLIHSLLLLGTWNLSKNEVIREKISFGAQVLKLQMASKVITSAVSPEVKRPRPSQKKITSTAQSGPVVAPETPGLATIDNNKKADIRAIYKAELRSRIEENKFYPTMSRRLGQTGTVVVGFTLLEDGHIVNIRVDEPSRYESLNESAMDAVKKVHVFKPIPKELGDSKMEIKVPLKFFTI